MIKRLALFSVLTVCLSSCSSDSYDVCVYGGTASGAIAAYAASVEGADVMLIGPDIELGGMTTGGLGQTDIGNKQAVVGVSRQFYRKLGEHYGKFEQWQFEPSVAQRLIDEYVDRPNITVRKECRLNSVEKKGTRIISLTCTGADGTDVTVKARTFIDCTYEGDLLAAAGVSYALGRESNDQYGETYDGSQLMNGHQFPDNVDPFVVPGDPDSGLLWGISDNKLKETGTGDDFVQAYNYRICLTDDPDNLIPITRPANYDSTRYELLLRLFDAQPDKRNLDDYFIWTRMPNHKTDVNNKGAFSTDMIGMNYNFPTASWEERDALLQAHTDYTIGLLWFYGHDPRVPKELQEQMLRWGYPKDEYPKTNHWTHQLYVREGRRLIGEYVATQADCEGKTTITDGIGYAAYGMDSHNCERLVIEKDGKLMVKNEGNVEIGVPAPYEISYRSLTPKREECTNLLVPVCVSSSHIAFGSIRMEPVFMGLGQIAGMAAARAGRKPVQSVDVAALQKSLAENPYMDGTAPDIAIAESSPAVEYSSAWELKGAWGCYGPTRLKLYGNSEPESVRYNLPESIEGVYEVYAYLHSANGMNTDYKYTITSGDNNMEQPLDLSEFTVDGQTAGEWRKIGEFDFIKGAKSSVTLTVGSSELPSQTDDILLVKK